MKPHPVRRLVLAAAIVAVCVPAQAQHVTSIDLAKSEIRFVSKQMNVPVEGRFPKFTARVDFDPAKLASSSAQVDVDLGSIDVGSSEADAEVRGKAWFNVPLFPTATFRSTGFKSLGGSRYEVAGKLTIKGRTMDVVAPFTVAPAGDKTVFEGSFLVFRLQFSLGEGVWKDTDTVANEVRVNFKLLGSAAGPPARPAR